MNNEILFISDTPTEFFGYRNMLEANGFETSLRGQGQDTYDYLETKHPTFVIVFINEECPNDCFEFLSSLTFNTKQIFAIMENVDDDLMLQFEDIGIETLPHSIDIETLVDIILLEVHK